MLRTARWRVVMALSLMVSVLTVLPTVAAFAAPEDLVISEVMYDPGSAEDDWEWIEIANPGDTDIDLADWVVDDINNTAHGAANIAAGTVPAAGSAILFNADDLSVADFEAAWGTGMNLVAVTGWTAMALNNGGDTIGLWSDFASYTGDQATHANAIVSQTYADIGANVGSVYLSDLADDTTWVLSADGVVTPVGTVYASANAGGNNGGELGSPGGTLDGGGGEPDPADHLLLTEFVVTPTEGEFVEIYNPTDAAVDLTDVYLTDAYFGGGDFYWNIVTGTSAGGGGFGDWHARFPAGASIAADEYQTIALNGSDDFFAAYGVDPTYEIGEDGDGSDLIPEMLEALPGSINFADGPGLSDSGEAIVLYEWDGLSDLVQDLDYVVWGDKAEAHDKTGITIDGPDADLDTSAYLPDTASGFQEALAGAHAAGASHQRRDLSEGAETKDGGNGVTSNDETSENLTVTWGETAPNPNAATTLPPPDTGGGGPDPLPEPGICGDPFTAISAIQGTGDASLLDGTPVITEGVVTAILDGLGGFNIQDPVGDGVETSSEGIFVFADSTGLAVGDAVRVVGHVDEFFELTEITSLTDEDVIVLACGAGAAIAPTLVSLPTSVSLEPYEGMLVTFDDVFVTDTFDLIQFGQFEVSGPDRLFIPTDLVDPGAPNATLQAQNDRSRFIIDDGSSLSNPSPVPFIEDPAGTFNTFRLGDRVVDPVGVMYFGFGDYQLIPTADVVFDSAGRPDAPDVGGNVQVASLNVLNYFTTLNERGADTTEELVRQGDKLVAAIQGLDAAIVGVQEIENNGPVAIGSLVDALNAAATGGETWAAVADPDYPGGLESTNAIKVGIIYRSDLVSTIDGPFTSLDEDFSFDRPPVGQTFNADGEVFTVIVNHFKSKGCTGTGAGEEFEAEADIGDGQACYSPRRTRMAEATLDLVAETQAATGDADVLVIGDLNSYYQEDPTDVLRAGLVDLTGSQSANERRSFVFRGQAGQLDYAFATPELAAKVTGAAHWHINADELRNLDYNTEFNPAALYNVDPYRSSDHDPLLVGIGEAQLAPRLAILAVAEELAELPPTGRFWDDWRIRRAVDRLERAADPDSWVGDDHVKIARVYNDVVSAVRRIDRLRNVDGDPYIEALVAAMADVSELAVDEAINADGIPWAIARALDFLDAGDRAWSDGDAVRAIRDYRRAWWRAGVAISRPRFATFNASLNRNNGGELVADLLTGGNAQAQTIAEIIQVNRPNVVLINEFDYDSGGLGADLFRSNYLEVSQNGQDAIFYPYAYVAESNTGIDSGFDLNNDGATGTADDAFGFGFFPGQYGMLVLSQHPLDLDEVRTFQNFLWKDMPGALLPDDPDVAGEADWYSPEELDVFRLSSKSHWDVPVVLGRSTVHFLVSHPTPPVFDGDEDRNGTRNHDEIRFWADYVDPGASGYIYDDNGGIGGLAGGARFVIAGDQNSDPFDGDSIPGSAQQLLDSPYVNTLVTPDSEGGPEQAVLQGGANDTHLGDPAFDTADFSDSSSGNLRADYVLPSYNIWIRDAGVFWPLEADPLFPLVGTFPFPSSDHRLVWVDMSL